MLRKALQIAMLYLNTTVRRRSVYIFALLMPLLFTFVIGQAFSGTGDGGVASTSWPLNVVNDDVGELGANLVMRLDTDPALDVYPMERETALAEVEQGQVSMR